MSYSLDDLDVLEKCWGYLFDAITRRRDQVGPIGETGEIETQTEAGLIAFAIESFRDISDDRDAFLGLVELTWDALEKQKHEAPDERERRKRDHSRWERERTEAFRARLAARLQARQEQVPEPPSDAPVPVRWEDIPPHATSAARCAADSSGGGVGPAQQPEAVLEPWQPSAAVPPARRR